MTNRPRHILTDIDGTCVNWIDSFEEYMKTLGYKKVPNTDTEYNIGKRYDITFEESRRLVREFNEGDAIQHLQPLPDAVEYMAKLHRDHGFTFTAITAMSTATTACANRTANLEKHFGKIFSEIRCLEIGADKYEELQRWADSKFFWIEDHIGQAQAGQRAGLRSVLITDSTNAHRVNNTLERAASWKDVYELVCDAYGLVK